MFEQFAIFNSLTGYIVLGVIFLAAVGLTFGIGALLRGNETTERLDTILQGSSVLRPPGEKSGSTWTEKFAKVAAPIAKHTRPKEDWEKSHLRRQFMHAGWRHPLASEAYFGAKGLFGLGVPLLAFLYQRNFLPDMQIDTFLILMGAALVGGYYLPNFWLNRSIRLRQRELFENFPDALDLLTICVEAGLGLEGALARVANEIRLSSQELADELEMVTLEMRAGGGKERALRNLAYRTGLEDIEGTVAMLVQSDRFGTSIGESLRIQSDTLRTKRMQRAEELAAKVAVKLVFPLVICILPTIFIVTGGPAMIQITRSFAEIFGAQ